eukprot:1372538-Amorphochlora_amoeboformis.AAC.1
MDGSVYQWFRKCNQAKPYLKKIVTVSRRYGNEDELKDLDPEEAEKAMCEAFSWDCEIINGIIKTSPYHAQTSSTLLFELRRCKPLKAIPAVVIRNLCQLGQSLPKGFQEYSPALAHELVMSGTNSLRELASDGETKDLDVAMSALGMLPKNSKLAHHLYHALATGAGGEKPSLASVLGSHEVWSRVFQACGTRPEDWKLDTRLVKVLRHTRKLLIETAESLRPGGSIRVGPLLTVAGGRLGILELFTILEIDGITQG